MGAEAATADGSLVNVSTKENPELFWGIRGGGGNFGIVTSLKFQLHKLRKVVGGMIVHPQNNAKEVIQFYREFMKTAPNDLTLYAALLTLPDGFPVVGYVGVTAGKSKMQKTF